MDILLLLCLALPQTYAEIPLNEEIFTSLSTNKEPEEDVVFSIDPIRNFVLNVPEECKKIGLCENIPNFPREIVSGIIDRILQERGLLETEEMSRCYGMQHLGDEIQLCKAENFVLYPKAAMDNNGDWNLVLNSNTRLFQGFCVTICKGTLDNCSSVASFNEDYRGVCKQDYMQNKMYALNLKMDKVIRKRFLVPSCCNCLAVAERLT